MLFMLIFLMAAMPRAHAQASDIRNLFRELESVDAGTQETFDKADPVLARLVRSSRESVLESLPVILQATRDSHLSVRRVAAMALYEISERSDGQSLLSTQTDTFETLLVDPDLPIRRVSMLAVATLRPDANSPIMPFLRKYLAREDAVSTIGAFVATVLMEAVPNDTDSTTAVALFMHRADQTSESKEALMNAIVFRAKSHNRKIAKEVAAYAGSPNEEESVQAIQTLQAMGSNAVSDNQQVLSRIAADTSRSSSVRTAAAKVLSGNQ